MYYTEINIFILNYLLILSFLYLIFSNIVDFSTGALWTGPGCAGFGTDDRVVGVVWSGFGLKASLRIMLGLMIEETILGYMGQLGQSDRKHLQCSKKFPLGLAYTLC